MTSKRTTFNLNPSLNVNAPPGYEYDPYFLHKQIPSPITKIPVICHISDPVTQYHNSIKEQPNPYKSKPKHVDTKHVASQPIWDLSRSRSV